jgi:aminoglycoside 2''-phosphotransferase
MKEIGEPEMVKNEKENETEKIRKEFPDLRWENSRRVGSGWDHEVIILDEKIAFRFPRDEYLKEKLILEINLLKYLNERLKMTIPEYKWIAKSDVFAGYEMIQGESLKPEKFDRMDDEDKNMIVKQIADFFTSLHSLPVDELKNLGVKDLNTERIFTNMEKETKDLFPDKISNEEIESIEQFLPVLRKTFEDYPNKVFTHGDVSASNILIKNNRVNGIIDFTDRGITDPAIDFGRLWEFGKKFVEDVYKEYKADKDPDFFERSKIYYKMTALWVLIAACEGHHQIEFEKGYEKFKKRFYA